MIIAAPITSAPNATRAPAKKATVALDQIDFPANARPTHSDKVRELANSIRRLGLQTLPTVVERDGRYKLVAGRHRVEALRILKRDPIDVRVVDFDDIEARLWTISENLHRNELRPLDRDEQIAEWIRLTEVRQASQVETIESKRDDGTAEHEVSSQVATKPQGGRPESGIRAAARELGVGKDEAHRAVKVDSIIPAAKEAAREAGLDRNHSALLKVASYADADQVEAVADIAKARAERTQAPAQFSAKPLRNLECISAGEFARWIKITTPNDRPHVIRVLRMAADILADEIEGSALLPVPTGHSADPDESAAAIAFLEGELASGARNAADIEAAGTQAGLTVEALAKARHRLGVQSTQRPGSARRWQLPPRDAVLMREAGHV
jgi:ParB family transcriptional regulator, chromosome partitioning protein